MTIFFGNFDNIEPVKLRIERWVKSLPAGGMVDKGAHVVINGQKLPHKFNYALNEHDVAKILRHFNIKIE
jgi:hypothetical protein